MIFFISFYRAIQSIQLAAKISYDIKSPNYSPKKNDASVLF